MNIDNADAMTQRRMVQSPRIRTHRHVEYLGRYGTHVRRGQCNVHRAQVYQRRVLSCEA
jgi:hypothetical protein